MIEDTKPPAETAAKAMLGALLRKLLAILGTALVTRGFVTQGQVDGFMPMIVEQLVGYILVGVATGWSLLRAKVTHTRWAKAWRALIGEDGQ